MHLYIYTDGASRGNPGPSSIGIVIKDAKKQILMEISDYIGEGTNNNAEYLAVIRAVKEAIKLKADSVTIYLDSELIQKQLNGQYKVKNKTLQKYFIEILNLRKLFSCFDVYHIPRSQNSEADRLANLALNRHSQIPQI